MVILGAGFAGLEAARTLSNAPVRVTVVDRQNYHLFQPLLYQVAGAVLDPSSIAAPVRHILRRSRNTTVLMAEATSIDLAGRRVQLDADRVLEYDHLIVALGASHSYFGRSEWSGLAPGLKTLDDALEMRRRILSAFEQAEREEDPTRQAALLTFAVVGGGPTGVELAGALAEIAKESLASDFRRIDPARARILLLEGLPRLLTAYAEALAAKARRDLERLGVEVRTSAKVSDIDEGGVYVGEERIPCCTVLWAAGVSAPAVAATLEAPKDRAGRILVTPRLTVPGHEEVYVVGDLAALVENGRPVPGLAPAALQEGKHAALNVLRATKGLPALDFHYRDRGSFAVIGRGAGVGILGRKVQVSGFLAWLLWLTIHVFFLIGFRNRLAVMFSWAYSFFTFRRHARLITGRSSG